MITNYIKIALRNITRYKGFSFIGIAGLATGIACCMLMLLFVKDELSYDRYHENSERIYRVVEIIGEEGRGERSSSNPFPVGPTLVLDYPNTVEAAVRFFNFQAPMLTVSSEDRKFNERKFFFVDSTVFQVFSWTLEEGNPATALAEPNSVVLTREVARKFFDDKPALGKVLRFEGKQDLKITGILAEVPLNSHFRFDYLASFSTLPALYNGNVPNGWYWNPCWTYVLLKEGLGAEALASQFPAFVQKYFPQVIKHETVLRLQSLSSIHLTSRLDFEIEPNGNEATVYIFSVIAAFVLVIACINYTNLATARSSGRSREIGIRKVLGAHRGLLIKQIMFESMITSAIAILMALGILELLISVFNSISGKILVVQYTQDTGALAALFGIGLFTGFVSGIYPAFVLSSFQPIAVLKNLVRINPRQGNFRKVLVTAQFVVSGVLIIGTLVAAEQLEFLRTTRLGFDKEQVVMIPVARSSIVNQYDSFKTTLLQQSAVVAVTSTEDIVGSAIQTGSYFPEGTTESRLFSRLNVREDFAKTFAIQIIAGRDYSEDIPTDYDEAVIINEAMVRYLGWESPEKAVGKRFSDGDTPARVIGVMKDFHFTSLHQPVAPFVLEMPDPEPGSRAFFLKYIAVRIRPEASAETIAFLGTTWNNFSPERPFEFFMLDENLNQLYRSEETLGRVAGAFSLLAIMIACLGLFGLTAFITEQRTKEIGIRKVLGASVTGVVGLLSKDFLKLVLIANLIAWPVAYTIMSQWLENFAYRIEIGWWVFALAGGAALAIAVLTVSFQAIRAALANPVEALKYE